MYKRLQWGNKSLTFLNDSLRFPPPPTDNTEVKEITLKLMYRSWCVVLIINILKWYQSTELRTSNIFFLRFKFSLVKSGTREKRLTEHSAMKLMREGIDGKGQITFLADVPFHAQFNLCDLRKRRLHDCFACNIVEKKTISGRVRASSERITRSAFT